MKNERQSSVITFLPWVMGPTGTAAWLKRAAIHVISLTFPSSPSPQVEKHIFSCDDYDTSHNHSWYRVRLDPHTNSSQIWFDCIYFGPGTTQVRSQLLGTDWTCKDLSSYPWKSRFVFCHMTLLKPKSVLTHTQCNCAQLLDYESSVCLCKSEKIQCMVSTAIYLLN